MDFNSNSQTVSAGGIGRCQIIRQLQLGVVFIVAEEEFVLFYEAYSGGRVFFLFLTRRMKRFPAECKADFRVEKRDISLLLDVLRVPPVSVQCCNGTICDGVEGLCIGWLHVHVQNITELKEGINTHKV